jgi:hypothetical protein
MPPKTLEEQIRELLSRLDGVCAVAAIHHSPYTGGDLTPEFMALLRSTAEEVALRVIGDNLPADLANTDNAIKAYNLTKDVQRQSLPAILDEVLGEKKMNTPNKSNISPDTNKNEPELEVSDSPMGFSNWLAHGEKYGYLEFAKEIKTSAKAKQHGSTYQDNSIARKRL